MDTALRTVRVVFVNRRRYLPMIVWISALATSYFLDIQLSISSDGIAIALASSITFAAISAG